MDDSCQRIACPACNSPRGEPCVTWINGADVGWTHDARVLADMGVQSR